MARVAAIGDAHLGRSYLQYTDDQSVNVRERDFDRSFTAAVDLALAQEPDLVVWLGDIFDHPRPTFRTYRVVQQALAKVRDHGIHLALITGNHDTPRLPGTGSPYTTLADAFPEFSFAHRMSYERFDLAGLVVHAVPQMLTVEATLEALDQAASSRSADKSNLLLCHPLLPSVERKYADINEIEVDDNRLQADFVLLGHYHAFTQVRPGEVWYAGSTDSFNFGDEPDKPKGIVVLDTDSGACTHVPLSNQRPLVTLEELFAQGLSATELQDAIIARAAAIPDGAVARLYLDRVDPESYRLLDRYAVNESHSGLDLKLIDQPLRADARFQGVELSDLGAQWHGYLSNQDLEGYDRDRIKAMGDAYLSQAVEEAI